MFTWMLNMIVAIMLLIGNSSYTITTKGQSIDSLRPITFSDQPTNDDTKSTTITVPTKKMIRRADSEINRNMNDFIEMINKFRIAHPNYQHSDDDMTKQFLNYMNLPITLSSIEDCDEYINLLFRSENLDFKGSMIQADHDINHHFISSILISSGSKYNNICADAIMNKNFYVENH